MSKKMLKNIKLGMTWTTYTASVYGVLKHAKMWDDEMWKLTGLTGMGFHFIIHDEICPSSVTVYDWTNEHIMMMDRIGVSSEVVCIMNHTSMNTGEQLRNIAAKRIKESIDSGKGVIVWTPTPVLEFGIVKGYDDEDGVFFVEGCCEGEPDPLLYKNIGISEVPILFYQIVNSKIDIPQEKMIRVSLEFGINEWKKNYHINPRYSSGKRAYQTLIKALEKGEYNPFGLGYNLAVYSDSKKNLAEYIDFVNNTGEFTDKIDKAANNYKKIAKKFEEMAKTIPFMHGGAPINPDCIPHIIDLMKESMSLEEDAIKNIEKVLEG